MLARQRCSVAGAAQPRAADRHSEHLCRWETLGAGWHPLPGHHATAELTLAHCHPSPVLQRSGRPRAAFTPTLAGGRGTRSSWRGECLSLLFWLYPVWGSPPAGLAWVNYYTSASRPSQSRFVMSQTACQFHPGRSRPPPHGRTLTQPPLPSPLSPQSPRTSSIVRIHEEHAAGRATRGARPPHPLAAVGT